MIKITLFKQLPVKTLIITVVILGLVGVAGASYYMYYQAQKEVAKLSTPEGQQQMAEKEIDGLLSAISKRMILPDNEKPTIATVTDVEAIKKDQPFFEKAKNGDKVLVYVGAKKAIIYRSDEDLIVNVGFIAVNDDSSQVAGATTEATPLTVEIRNGTQTAGLGQKLADSLKSVSTIQKIGDAKKKDYTKTILIDLGKADKNSVESLAKKLSAEIVTSLPEEEPVSASEALVIVGTDRVTL